MTYQTGREALAAHQRRLRDKPPGVARERQAQLAKEWGNQVKGWVAARGGWVYTSASRNATVCQGWSGVWTWHQRAILDWLTASLTAARTLDELCASGVENHYRPTILPRNWRYVALADAYDERQWERRDPRRAWRGSTTKESHR